MRFPISRSRKESPRRWWPWVLALVVLANLGIMAAYAWDYVVPGRDDPASGVETAQVPETKSVPDADTPAIPALAAETPAESLEEINNDPAPDGPTPDGKDTGDAPLDEAALAESFPLEPAAEAPADSAPATSRDGAGSDATGQIALVETPPAPDLSRPLSPDQLPNASKTLGPGPEGRDLQAPSTDDSSPPTQSEAPGIEALTPAKGEQLAANLVVPEPREKLPPPGPRRPTSAVWIATTAAARAAEAAAAAAVNPAPLAPVKGSEEVATLTVVPPQPPPEEVAAASTANSAATQAADTSPQLETTLGALETEEGADSDRDLPRFDELSQELRTRIPQIKLSAHVFDPDPKRRFARINRKKYREGDEIAGGLWLDAVTTEGIILRYIDTRFRMSNF